MIIFLCEYNNKKMYRFLLGFLVLVSVVLSLSTLISLNQASIDQQTPNTNTSNLGPLAPPNLGGVQDYTKQNNNLTLSFTNRLATHSYGLIAGLISLFFLYRKVYRSTTVMYLPLLSSAIAVGLYMYNTIVVSSNLQIFTSIYSTLDDSKLAGKTDDEGVTNMYLDLSSSVIGAVAHAFSILYLVNRRL